MNNYIYKVGFYETKKHTVSYSDMYFAKLEDCLWAYETYNSKNDHNGGDKECFDIQILRVSEEDDRYESAVSNSALPCHQQGS